MSSDIEELENLQSEADEMELKELEIQLSVASLLAMFPVRQMSLTLWKDKAFWLRLTKAIKGLSLPEDKIQTILTSMRGK